MKHRIFVTGSCALVVALIVGPAPIRTEVNHTVTAHATCVTLKLTATPKVNAQTAPNETIKNTVTSCSAASETVTLQQETLGPSVAVRSAGTIWTIKLKPRQSVTKTQRIPWTCCGSYTVSDKAVSSSRQVLATKETGFTFA